MCNFQWSWQWFKSTAASDCCQKFKTVFLDFKKSSPFILVYAHNVFTNPDRKMHQLSRLNIANLWWVSWQFLRFRDGGGGGGRTLFQQDLLFFALLQLTLSFTFLVDYRKFRTLQWNWFSKHANMIMCNLFLTSLCVIQGLVTFQNSFFTHAPFADFALVCLWIIQGLVAPAMDNNIC